MKNLIKHILQESSTVLNILNIIKDEDIFAAAEMVGGFNNLKKILKDFPDLVEEIDSMNGKVVLNYPGVDFPLKFEIIGIHVNIWRSNRWPEVNLIYDESKLTDEEKEIFKEFIEMAVQDGDYYDFEINPEVLPLFNITDLLDIKQINGKPVEETEEIIFGKKDLIKIKEKLYGKNPLNESEEDPSRKILNFLIRRYKVEEKDLGWEDHPIMLKTITFEVDGERYGISTFQNKRDQIRVITDMLIIHNIIEPIDPYERQLDPYTQKVIRVIKQFINQVM
jgi:hypothetical protein